MPDFTYRPLTTWPGELTRHRRHAPFTASCPSTLRLLDTELHHLGAKDVVLQVALAEGDIRNDGKPRANARPAHPGVVLTLESKYGPLQYPCDTFFDFHDNMRAIALALEALRKVDRYGVTKRGEQYTGWKSIGAGTPMGPAMTVEAAARFLATWSNPDDLGDQGWEDIVDDPTIRPELYRVAAKRLHPDAGGNHADFVRLQNAKAVLDKHGAEW